MPSIQEILDGLCIAEDNTGGMSQNLDFKGQCSSSWIYKETLLVYHEKYSLHANIHKEDAKFLQDCAMVHVKATSGCPNVTELMPF
jgi:hypothetical protein